VRLLGEAQRMTPKASATYPLRSLCVLCTTLSRHSEQQRSSAHLSKTVSEAAYEAEVKSRVVEVHSERASASVMQGAHAPPTVMCSAAEQDRLLLADELQTGI